MKNARRQERQLHGQRKKGWRSMNSEAWMTRMTLPPKHGSKPALTSCCRPKPGVTQTGWQYCGHKWPETSAHQCRKRSRSKGGMNPRRAAEISIVTGNGNFWTTHREWMAHVEPRHIVLGQEHPLEAGRCEEQAEARAPRLALRFLTRETQCSEDEIRCIAGDVGRYFRRSAQALADGVAVAGARLAEQRASGAP